MLTFLREVRSELEKVVWPTSREVARLTFIVIAISLIAGVYLGGLDFLFTSLLGIVIK